jgi:hypothetical protein
MAALDILGAVDNVKNMLGGLQAWHDICGVDNQVDAKKRIYKGGKEESADCTLCPCIILDARPLGTNWMASRSRGELSVEIRMELEIPEPETETHERQWIWMHTQTAAMLAGINGGVQSGSQLMLRSLSVTLPPGAIDPDDNHGRVEWGTILEATMDFI